MLTAYKNNTNTGTRLTQEVAIERVKQRCAERDMTFIGFNNPSNTYENDQTKLVLKCNKCGNTWDHSTYARFVRGSRKCPFCNVHNKAKHVTKEEILEQILQACKEKDFTFLGFNTEDGEFHSKRNKLILKCNKCGRTWDSTCINGLLNPSRGNHICSRINFVPVYANTHQNRLNKIKETLKNDTVEVVELDGNIITFKCKNCGKTFTYTNGVFYGNNGNIHCKHCDVAGRLSQEEAMQKVLTVCKNSDFTFIGFNTDDGSYKGQDTRFTAKCNHCGRIFNRLKFEYLRNQDVITCTDCKFHYKMERDLETSLQEQGYEVQREQVFDWLKYKGSMRLDIYLPKQNIAIECQGIQHFKPRDFSGHMTEERSREVFEESLERDKTKQQLCKENNVTLLYYSDQVPYDTFLGEKLIKSKKELLEILKKYEEN